MNTAKSSGGELATSDSSPATSLPRVLVLTREIPQSVNAGSQQLFRVLQGYPSEKLLVVGPPVPASAERLPCRYEVLVPWIERWVNTRLHKWVNLANALGVVPGDSLARINQLVRDFQPEVVLTVMDLFSFYKVAWRYARKHRIPLVTLTMDDPMHFQKVASRAKSLQKRAVKRIYQDATLSLGVSREMAAWIGKEFGKPTETLYFGPPDGLLPRRGALNATLRKAPRLTVGFAGNLAFYGRELSRLMPAFEQTGTVLNFYGLKTRDMPASPMVCERGFQPIKFLWAKVQQECDGLILPYPAGGPFENVFRTHFPTKLSEYLWQGMPVLITGPAYATGLRWGLAHADACVALTEPSIEEVAKLLLTWQHDSSVRCRLGEHALRVASAEFAPEAIRRKFQRFLVTASEKRD